MKMVFIAAGKGSRLSFVTNGMPKTLIKVFDRPLIDILLENCSSVGIQDIVIVTGYGQDYITDHFRDVTGDFNVEFVYNDYWKLPNGLSVLAAQQSIPRGEDFMVSMSDHFYSSDLFSLFIEKGLIGILVKFNFII